MKRALNLGVQFTPPKVDRVPHIPMLKENNVRNGFFEHEEFLSLREALPEYLWGFVSFGYKSGWRFPEIAGLTWGQIDRRQGIVTLYPGETKNDQARSLYMDDELKEMIENQWRSRVHFGSARGLVFPNRNSDGRIVDFWASWNAALSEAGLEKKVFHDLRRTAVRNMVRSGVPERVAMMVSGHKTRSVFDRYYIVSGEDLKLAAQLQQTYLDSLLGTIPGTIPISDIRKGHGQNP